MKMKRLLPVLTAAAAAILLTACSVQITSITLPESIELEKGESRALEAAYTTAQEASDESVAGAVEKLGILWSCSDETVAAVDEAGTVTALAAGEAEITAASADGRLSASCRVVVTVSPTGLQAPDTLELQLDGEEEKELGAALLPEDASPLQLTYTSSDEAVAAVDAGGRVTAVGLGECVVSVTAPGGLSAKTTVRVTQAVTGIRLSRTGGKLYVGGSVSVSVYTDPLEAPAPNAAEVTYTSDNEGVAVVKGSAEGDAGFTVKAMGEGSATITAEYKGSTAAYTVTVSKYAAPVQTETATSSQTPGQGGGASAQDPNVETPPAPSAPATNCSIDASKLRADGSCPMSDFHWMYLEPTNGYAYSANLIAAWRAAASGNVIIPGGGIGDNPRCEQCNGEVVIVAPSFTLGCQNGCW